MSLFFVVRFARRLLCLTRIYYRGFILLTLEILTISEWLPRDPKATSQQPEREKKTGNPENSQVLTSPWVRPLQKESEQASGSPRPVPYSATSEPISPAQPRRQSTTVDTSAGAQESFATYAHSSPWVGQHIPATPTATPNMAAMWNNQQPAFHPQQSHRVHLLFRIDRLPLLWNVACRETMHRRRMTH